MHTLLRAAIFCGTLAASTVLAVEKPTLADLVLTPQANGAATVAVKVTANGDASSLVVHFGLTNQFGDERQSRVSADAVNEIVTTTLSGLIGGHKYFVKVDASNSAGTNSQAGDFTALPFLPAVTLKEATHAAGQVTLHGAVTTNGTPGVVYFEYGLTTTYDKKTTAVPVDASVIALPLTEPLTGLAPDKTYNQRLVFAPSSAAAATAVTANLTTNIAPVAKDDRVTLASPDPMTIEVLKNDTDAEGDTVSITDISGPDHGFAAIVGRKITYRPGKGFRGIAKFGYTIKDGFGGEDTASVTVRSAAFAIAGTHGGLLKDAAGKEIGSFRLTTLASGAFTATIFANGERHAFTGTLSADGKYRGAILVDDEPVDVELDATVGDSETSISANFGGGEWTASTTATPSTPTKRAELAGRYTVEFAGSSSTGGTAGSEVSTPGGAGWASVKLGWDGSARVKGRLADGRSFSTDGILTVTNTSAVLTFYDDPRDTRVIGSLTLGDAVTGSLHVDRDPSNRGIFPGGYDLTHTASGAPYVRPADGERAIEVEGTASGRQLTIAFSGGDSIAGFSRDLRLDEDDHVKVLNPGPEDLSVKIDRKSGRFKVKFTGLTENVRVKGTGVLIQATGSSAIGRGSGVFTGTQQTGRITITVTGATPPATSGGSGTGTGTGTTVR